MNSTPWKPRNSQPRRRGFSTSIPSLPEWSADRRTAGGRSRASCSGGRSSRTSRSRPSGTTSAIMRWSMTTTRPWISNLSSETGIPLSSKSDSEWGRARSRSPRPIPASTTLESRSFSMVSQSFLRMQRRRICTTSRSCASMPYRSCRIWCPTGP